MLLSNSVEPKTEPEGAEEEWRSQNPWAHLPSCSPSTPVLKKGAAARLLIALLCHPAAKDQT